MGYIDNQGGYYEGDRQGDDLIVSQRPSPDHIYTDGQWLYTAPPEVFAPLTPYQIRQVLNIFEIRQTVEDFIASAPIEVKDAWQYATDFKRDNPVLLNMAAQLELTDEQVDDMFRLGETLEPGA